MKVQQINNNSQPSFGYLNIEPSRRLVKYLGQYEKTQGVDIKKVIALLTSTLGDTKYLHGNLSYGKNNTRNKIPNLQVIIHKNIVFPNKGEYEITNKDGSTAIYKIISTERSLQMLEDNLITENSLLLFNGHLKDGNKVFDIENVFDENYDTDYGNEYFPIPNGQLFVNQIINADNIIQAFEEGRAKRLDEKCIEPYPYSPYIQSGYNEFMRKYNNAYPEFVPCLFT